MSATYTQIKGPVAAHQPFTGSSMSATRDGDVYTVFSYTTPVATLNMLTGEQWVTDTYYSTTTSRHLNLVRAYL